MIFVWEELKQTRFFTMGACVCGLQIKNQRPDYVLISEKERDDYIGIRLKYEKRAVIYARYNKYLNTQVLPACKPTHMPLIHYSTGN